MLVDDMSHGCTAFSVCAHKHTGAAACWGNGDFGVTVPPEYDGVPFLQVTTGRTWSCGMKVRGSGMQFLGVVLLHGAHGAPCLPWVLVYSVLAMGVGVGGLMPELFVVLSYCGGVFPVPFCGCGGGIHNTGVRHVAVLGQHQEVRCGRCMIPRMSLCARALLMCCLCVLRLGTWFCECMGLCLAMLVWVPLAVRALQFTDWVLRPKRVDTLQGPWRSGT